MDSESIKEVRVIKSLACARFLQALTVLCPNYRRSCFCNSNGEEWDKICNKYSEVGLRFWKNWVTANVEKTVETSEHSYYLEPIQYLPSLLVRFVKVF